MSMPVGETLQDLELAAVDRLAEATALLAEGMPTGACYLAGYAAEISLKAATFRLGGARLDAPVAAMRGVAQRRGEKLLPDIPLESGHNPVFWAALLQLERNARRLPDQGLLIPVVVARARLVRSLWTVDLRYRSNAVAEDDARRVMEAAMWISTQGSALWS